MPKMVVQGRDYPWPDPTTITFREAQIIKKRLGFSLMGVFQNLASGNFDEDVLLGMFVLAKLRTDGDFDFESIMDLSLTDISIEDDSEEDEEEVPLEQPQSEPEPEEKPKPARKKTASSTA